MQKTSAKFQGFLSRKNNKKCKISSLSEQEFEPEKQQVQNFKSFFLSRKKTQDFKTSKISSFSRIPFFRVPGFL
jgi:hypothetical protein